MAESKTHIDLVSALVSFVATTYFKGEKGSILVDSPESIARPRPISGFVPDVFASGSHSDLFFIGEAKTAGDIENRHTRDQLVAYLQFCNARPGSILHLAVPWHMTRCTRMLVRNIGRSIGCDSVETVVLDGLPG